MSERESASCKAYRKKAHPSHSGGVQRWEETEVADTLNIYDNSESRTPVLITQTVYDWHRQDSRMTECKDICVTAAAGWGGGGNNMPYVLEVYEMQETTGCLSPGAHAGSYNGQDAYNDMLVVDDVLHRERASESTLSSGDGGCAELHGRSTEDTENWGGGAMDETVVRRLTPLECERLQNYPDGWTDIGEWTDSKGKKHKDADSPRYKALGNSIALPFWEWMAGRICAQYDHPATMASLFDGIGGFPLVFSRHGATPVWASEIEEFPIAVTKIRFPESEEKK